MLIALADDTDSQSELKERVGDSTNCNPAKLVHKVLSVEGPLAQSQLVDENPATSMDRP